MIVDDIYKWARSQPTKSAILWNGHATGYAAFSRAIEASRQFLERQSLPAGQTAIVLVHHNPSAWFLVLALRCLRLDTISVASLGIAGALKLKRVACVVTTQAELHQHELKSDTLAGVKIIVVPQAIYASIEAGDLPAVPMNSHHFGGHIIYTSGSTATSKKLFHPSVHEDRRNRFRALIFSFNKATIGYGGDFGLWTAMGFRGPPTIWHVGGCVVYDQPSRALQQGANFFLLTPPMLKELVESINDPCGQPRDDCEVFVGTGFLAAALAERAITQVTKRIGITYSSTEIGSVTLLSRFETKDDWYWLAPPHGRTVQIVDELGNECSEGELRVLLTDIDCKSYLDDDLASAKAFRDGFFYSGDMAIRRSDGRIRILGRTEDVLNIEGQKIAVAPIEQELQREFGVEEVCLFTGLSATGVEELGVAIKSSRQFAKSDFEIIKKRFPSFAHIRVTVLKEFPVTTTGLSKTQRSELRKRVFREAR